MSIEVNGTIILLIALVVVGVLLYALVTMPRWCIRSIAKHALWRLRDEVVLDTVRGVLPAGNPAVRELVARTDWAIKEARSFDLVHMFAWDRATRGLPQDTLARMGRVPNFGGLTEDQAQRVVDYRTRYNHVAIKALLLSSWIGLAFMVRFLLPAAAHSLGRLARRGSIRVVVDQAANGVADRTALGRKARVFITAQGPEPGMTALA